MTNASARRLWGVGTSRTFRAHWALNELDLPYESMRIRPRTNDMDDPAFRVVSPEKKVPVLQDGSLILAESPAIVLYLSERYAHADGRLVPEPIKERARLFEWVSYVSMELDATSLYVLRRHQGLPETYGEAPAAVQAAGDYFRRMLGRAIRSLADERPFLLGENFSAADIMLASCFNMAERYDITLPDAIQSYRDRIRARPAFVRAMEANQP